MAFMKSERESIRIEKASGVLTVQTDSGDGFEQVPEERTFKLVPGFEAIPLSVLLSVGKQVTVTIRAGQIS